MKKDREFSSMQRQFKSLLRAVGILNLLEEKTALSVSEISVFSGLPRSSVYKYLSVMRECRLVDQDRNQGKYRLGMRLFELGTAVQNRIAIHRIARPYMEELANRLGETVGINVIDGNSTIFLETVEPENTEGSILFSVRKGHRFSLHAGAMGKIFLAHLPEERIDHFLRTQELVKYTEKTIVDPEELRKQMETIREVGYAVSDEEIDPGVMALAAPIFDHESKIMAGLVVFGPSQRIDAARKEIIRKETLEYSKKISERVRGGNRRKADKGQVPGNNPQFGV
jgi:IclR family transcriptional regulator, KDG regulon repressor